MHLLVFFANGGYYLLCCICHEALWATVPCPRRFLAALGGTLPGHAQLRASRLCGLGKCASCEPEFRMSPCRAKPPTVTILDIDILLAQNITTLDLIIAEDHCEPRKASGARTLENSLRRQRFPCLFLSTFQQLPEGHKVVRGGSQDQCRRASSTEIVRVVVFCFVCVAELARQNRCVLDQYRVE